jgi:hypothetical protein
MKKIIAILFLGVLLNGCDLTEEPLFLSNEGVYSTGANATAALDGIYQGCSSYFYYGNAFPFLNALYSGMMVSRRGGNRVGTVFNQTLGSLQPTSGEQNSNRAWEAMYTAIARANDAITSAAVTGDPQTDDEFIINDVVGQAYFIRAFVYFQLVNFYGDIPLRLEPTTADAIHLAVSSPKDVYAQIIEDLQSAQTLMNGMAGPEYAKVYAADMLLAKVYMTLATNPELGDGSGNYWQLAYNEAIKVFGQYTLVSDYASLWNEQTSDGTSESIFELQSSDEASHDWVRAYTPNNYISANTFGWLQVSGTFYDRHALTYPNDPRIASTYISTYIQQNNGNLATRYPDRTRNNFQNAHPYFFKFADKNQESSDRVGNQNIVIFRYADLLLMLAEISNELQNGEQMGYVTEVLQRVGLSPQAGYQGSQDEFRIAVMYEYQFELLGEFHDCWNNRRRGYDWIKTHIIDYHNQNPIFDPDVDVTLSQELPGVMTIPIPDTEVNTNQEIN